MFTLDHQTARLARLAVEQQRALCAGHSHRATRLGRLVIRAARLYARALRAPAAPAVDRAALWLGRQA